MRFPVSPMEFFFSFSVKGSVGNGRPPRFRSGDAVGSSPTRANICSPRGAAWSARHPVKVEAVGSNPIGDAFLSPLIRFYRCTQSRRLYDDEKECCRKRPIRHGTQFGKAAKLKPWCCVGSTPTRANIPRNGAAGFPKYRETMEDTTKQPPGNNRVMFPSLVCKTSVKKQVGRVTKGSSPSSLMERGGYWK